MDASKSLRKKTRYRIRASGGIVADTSTSGGVQEGDFQFVLPTSDYGANGSRDLGINSDKSDDESEFDSNSSDNEDFVERQVVDHVTISDGPGNSETKEAQVNGYKNNNLFFLRFTYTNSFRTSLMRFIISSAEIHYFLNLM